MAALDRQSLDLTFDCGAVWQVLPLRARGGTATTALTLSNDWARLCLAIVEARAMLASIVGHACSGYAEGRPAAVPRH